jgi:formiminotetrahydrofolate cyclodeaminase
LASSDSFLERSLHDFLEAVPARTPAPGGGAVAAIALSLACGLTAMAARFAPEDWERRDEVVARAEELRAAAQPLADADAAAYAEYLRARTASDAIVAIPFALAGFATETAELAALVAAEGNPNVRGDAAAGAELAAAAATIAARLVAINAPADARAAEAGKLALTAAEHARRVAAPDMS